MKRKLICCCRETGTSTCGASLGAKCHILTADDIPVRRETS